MAKITGGELLVDTLRGHGVRHVFSIIGGQMCSIYEALSRRPEMNLVTLRNEAAAPMMAAGCAAVTGRPSVSMCTVGAGVVYEVAGLLAAWYSYLPVISIAPQVQSWKMNPHQENLQGLNQDGIFAPITKWNAIIYHWERIPALVNRALREAQANAPGPVHLDVPVDVLFQTRKLDASKKSKLMPPAATTRFIGSLPGPEEQVGNACSAISRGERPVVLVGQGMGRPDRYPAIRDHLNRLRLPVLVSDCSFGTSDGKDASQVGALGLFSGSEKGRQMIAEADLILIIGLDDQIKEIIDQAGQDAAIVQVEVDPSALLTGRRDYLGVNADPISFFSTLNQTNDHQGPKWPAWLEAMQKTGETIALEIAERRPESASVFKGLAAGLGDDDIVVVDGAEPVRAARAFLRQARYRNLFLMNTRDMAGVGLPFALGAKIGMPTHQVTLIVDKDSLFRHLQELQTAVGLGIGISIICADPGEGQALTRSAAILQGLGCEIGRLPAGEIPQRAESRRRLQAWLCVDNRE